jgi:hypothetical protein
LSNIVERLTFDDCQHLSLGTPHPIFSLGTPGFADAPPVRAIDLPLRAKILISALSHMTLVWLLDQIYEPYRARPLAFPPFRAHNARMFRDEPPVRTIGRAAKPVSAVVRRELGPDDIRELSVERATPAKPLERIGQRHHALARLIAQGTPDWEAAAITGYTQSSISILKVDPTFKDLLKFYADSVDAQYVDLHSAMAGVALDAVMEIQTRLEENGDKIPIRELRELAATFADRTGHGPSSTSKVDVNVNIGAKMEEARRRIEERRKMIDVTPGE